MPFMKAKRRRAHSVVSGVRVKANEEKSDPEAKRRRAHSVVSGVRVKANEEKKVIPNSEREQDSPVEMGASNISRFKEMPFMKAKRRRAHSVVSGVRVKASEEKKAIPNSERENRIHL
ncbi:hypothetical protein TNCV_2359411 [Trichonephila clavipes]|nr:hypothetical protein TNCV_2359411 [Trichonephila clavipes]